MLTPPSPAIPVVMLSSARSANVPLIAFPSAFSTCAPIPKPRYGRTGPTAKRDGKNRVSAVSAMSDMVMRPRFSVSSPLGSVITLRSESPNVRIVFSVKCEPQ
jgi:hypothetical protein